MLENYKDKVFHNKEEAESKKRRNQSGTKHSEKSEIDTQEYDQFIENRQEEQVGDVKDDLGEQENNRAEDDIDTHKYGEETQQEEQEHIGEER
eukprot:1978144-Heterocapsa_arctica.AAC.1